MSTHKHIDKICCVILAAALVLTVLLLNVSMSGDKADTVSMGYSNSKLFDTSTVHSINIIMDDWDGFLETCTNEEYTACTVVIDNDAYKNVAIRAKGNTSLMQVQSYGNNRYSFKIEFDRYDDSQTYFGLDKLCLNNIIQDNTYMKDYLVYQMMGSFGAAAPLCSYANITVNGEDWGLYLAVEGIEESFLQRNYGRDYGNLYKPDSQSMGGGRGNGREFDMDNMAEFFDKQRQQLPDSAAQGDISQNGIPQDDMPQSNMPQSDIPQGDIPQGDMPQGNMPQGDMPQGNMPQGGIPQGNIPQGNIPQGGIPQGNIPQGNMPQGNMPQGAPFGGKGMGSDDVSLIYTDDEYESYSNIFDNAKTNITDNDKDRLIASLKSLNANEDISEVVDIDSVIRYFVVHNFVLNFDSYTGTMIHNYYLYEKDGKMAMLPWDYNLAFGGFQQTSDAASLVNYPIDSPVSGGTVDSKPMLAWIFEDESYTKLYHQYFNELISEYFDSGYFTEMIDTVTNMIAPYVEKDPTKFCTYEEFERGAATLKEFCLLRAESINGQLDGTIASTSEAQQSDNEGFINADGITISDMGSMNNSMGWGGGHPAGHTQNDGKPTDSQQTDDNQTSDKQTNDKQTNDKQTQNDIANSESGNNNSNNNNDTNNNNNKSMYKHNFIRNDGNGRADIPGTPDIPNMRKQLSAGKGTAWILLGVSVCVLLSGVIFAVFYKRRKKCIHH